MLPVNSAMLLAIVASVALCAESTVLLPTRRALVYTARSGQPSMMPLESHAPWGLFWDGIDILDADDADEDTHLSQSKALSPLVQNISALDNATVGVDVIGLQDTGTNLLSQLLYRNFASQVAHYDSAQPNEELSGVWKHANMDWIDRMAPQAFSNLKGHNVMPLVMIRNPLSWLMSIRKAPYELAACVSGDDWLERPCVHSFPAGYVEKYGFVGEATFEHLSDVWGSWTKTYEPVLQRNFGQVIVIKYEDLVLNTENTMRKLATDLQLEMPNVVDIVEDPAKSHGAAVGHAEAVRKILRKEYLMEFSVQELATVCYQLKQFEETMVLYGYNDCDEVLNITYIGSVLGA